MNQCPVCQQKNSHFVFEKDGYKIVRCTQCQLEYVNPIPSAEFLQAHYQNPDYFEGDETQGYHSYADMHKAFLPHFTRRLQVLHKQLPQHGALLDFGCAAGYFLELAKAENWQIHGVELSTQMAEVATQTLQTPIATSLNALTRKNFDALTLWEVIEHLPNPIEQLQQLYDCLRPGGVLMLSTPNTGHWQALTRPNEWEGYRPPSHLLFFTAQTLENTLKQVGFTQVQVQKVAPLPPLPAWLERLSTPLKQNLATGQARFWPIALFTWRAIRIFGWGWQKIFQPKTDIFATLEAIAIRPT